MRCVSGRYLFVNNIGFNTSGVKLNWKEQNTSLYLLAELYDSPLSNSIPEVTKEDRKEITINSAGTWPSRLA